MNRFSVEDMTDLMIFCKEYLHECLHTNKGSNILYLDNTQPRGYNTYLSTLNELGTLIRPDLNRNESIFNIVHVVDCSKFSDYNNNQLTEMSYQLSFMLFGIKCGIVLAEECRMVDNTEEFLKLVLKDKQH